MFGTKPSVAVLFDRSPPNRAQPASPDFEAARRLVQQGKYDEAVAALRELEAKAPRTTGLSHELGIVHYKKNDFMKAIAYFLLRMRPYSYWAFPSISPADPPNSPLGALGGELDRHAGPLRSSGEPSTNSAASAQVGLE
jgi:tetratricopeptide (TPR) repeat protein